MDFFKNMNMNGSHATRLWLKGDDTMNVWNAIEHVKKRGMLFRHKIIKYYGEPKTNTLIFLNGDEYYSVIEERWNDAIERQTATEPQMVILAIKKTRLHARDV